jgi:MFS family permease
MAGYGAMVGIAAFAAVILAAPCHSLWLFAGGTFCIGFGAGLFGHGTLTATMRLAPPGQAGLALGAWGAVQATAAGLAIALGGILRDSVTHLVPPGIFGPARGYDFVYSLEVALLCVTLLTMTPLLRRAGQAAIPPNTHKRQNAKGISMRLSRLYNNAEDAAGAVKELRDAGFGADSITLVTSESGYISAETMRDRGIIRAHAENCAAAVKAGGALVIINPVLGLGQLATDLLLRPRAADTGPSSVQHEGEPWDPAAPFSSAFFMPVKLDRPAPLSHVANIPTLTKPGWHVSDLFGLKMLTHNPAPLSSAINAKTKSDNPAPLSSLLRLPLLLRK